MKITINRAPVLTLWAATVAERMGHSWESALSLGKAVAGLTAQAKGRTLGIYAARTKGGSSERKEESGAEAVEWITVCGKPVPTRRTAAGVRAVAGDTVIEPEGVDRYLGKAYGEALQQAREAMRDLAGSLSPRELEERAYALYEQFRPTVASGTRGWGQKGELDTELVRSLAGSRRKSS